jgi:anti-anti-sigma factor
MPTEQLTVAVSHEAGRQVVAVAGELDAHSAEVLQGPLMELTHAPGARVVVDVSDVSFLDSSGLRVLILAHKEVTGQGGEFCLRGASGAVDRILAAAGLSDYFGRE